MTWRELSGLQTIGFLTAVMVVLGLSVLGLALLLAKGEGLWSVRTLDFVVRAGLVALAVLSIILVFSSIPLISMANRRRYRQHALRFGGALLLLLTFFAGYSSFRNQGRLLSEASLSESGSQLYSLEMSNPGIRCVYSNYGFEDTGGCLTSFAKDEKSWSFVIFYVEESWFQLSQAKEEQDEWGSTYAEQVKYWAQDVERDPTGIFSFYLISSEASLIDAEQTMRDSNLWIAEPCAKFHVVWEALEKRRRLPRMVSGAAKDCASKFALSPTILTRPTLPIRRDT